MEIFTSTLNANVAFKCHSKFLGHKVALEYACPTTEKKIEYFIFQIWSKLCVLAFQANIKGKHYLIQRYILNHCFFQRTNENKQTNKQQRKTKHIGKAHLNHRPKAKNKRVVSDTFRNVGVSESW